MDEKKLTDKKLQETLNKICNARKNQYANMKLENIELISIEEHKKQLVETRKDTAEEILYDIKYGFVFSYKAKNEAYQEGYEQALEDYDNNLVKLFKERYGVEVE